MEVIAFNGSPRKTWNTATLLQKALEGAASKGATTKLIHLYDLDYKGCQSCFGCKTKGGPSYGKCAVKDHLTPILKNIESVDAVILGSPVYFWGVSGEMKSFMERLMYPFYRSKKDNECSRRTHEERYRIRQTNLRERRISEESLREVRITRLLRHVSIRRLLEDRPRSV